MSVATHTTACVASTRRQCELRQQRSFVRVSPKTSFKAKHAVLNNSVRVPLRVQYSADANINAKGSSSGAGAQSEAGNTTKYTWQNRAQSMSADEVLTQAKDAFSLIEEITQITISAGPSGITRGFKAFEAVIFTGQEILQGERPSAPVLLRRLFERLGSTYVKLGQFIASSPTLFPEEYVLEFTKCLDSTPAIPYAQIEKTLKEEFTSPLDSIFTSIDPEPLASASIAQVHCAVLRGSNKEVVIKVLKPGVSDVLNADLSFLYVASKVLEFLNPEFKRMSMANIVGDIRTSMMEEVDFLKEARNVEQFQDYLDRMDLGSVAVAPFVYKELSSRRVMVMERLRGSPLTDLEAIKRVSPGNDPEATLIAALNTWFGSVVMCETFHADVHAGNLLVLPDGRVGFIDFGIVGRISPVTWNAIQAFTTAAASSDFIVMAGALAQMGATDQEVDVKAFALDLELLYQDLNKIDAELVVEGVEDPLGAAQINAGLMMDDTQINELLINVVRVGETHGVKFPREFGLLLKQVLYFDRYVRLLAPGLQVFNDDRVNMGPGAGMDGMDSDSMFGTTVEVL